MRFQPPVNREVTAADFKYSFERMLRSPLAPGTSFYMGVLGAKAYESQGQRRERLQVVDPHTIRIKLVSPDLSFLNALTMEFTDVIPKEWVAKWGKRSAGTPSGTGPYMMNHWTPGQEIVLDRNPNYWEKGLALRRPRRVHPLRRPIDGAA